MQTYTKDDLDISYTYDANGLRGSKTVNGVKSDYLYLDGKLVYEKKGDVDIYYNYDSYGNFAGMKWYDAAGTAYALYALTNAQGDVLGLYNGNGELKIAYTYDTWGKVLSETDAQGNPLTGNLIEYSKLNPFRYRGYYYDSETGLYYLQSRYYDPEIGRFLNSDNITDPGAGVLGYNTFLYCANNPVNASDPTGHSIILACLIGGAIIGAITGGAIGASVSKIKTGKVSVKSVVVGALAGAVIGGAVGAAMGALGEKIATKIGSKGLSGLSKNASSKVSAENFLKSNGQNPDEILSCFKGTPKVKTLKADTTVYRTWGGDSREIGHWVSPNNYGSSARNLLSLPASNTMTNTSTFLLPKGTTVLTGEAAPLFGQTGGGVQWWISVLG